MRCRHVRVHHSDQGKDDPQLRDVLSQRPELQGVRNKEEREVEEFLKHRHNGGVMKYLVKWVGYSSEYNQWVAESNLAPNSLRAAYDAQKRRRGRPKQSPTSRSDLGSRSSRKRD